MEKSASDSIFLALGWIAIVMWAADMPPVGDREVTTYHVFCAEYKPAEKILYREVYRADVDTLTVTSWGKDGGTGVYLYHDCAIQNKSNWVCENRRKEEGSQVEMHDGMLTKRQFDTSLQVQAYKWW